MMKRVPQALFLLSLSIIGFQIILMRILSVNQWDNFANLIISTAMLGFGSAGSFLAVFKKRLLRRADTLIPLLMILCPVFMLSAYRVSQAEAFRFDTYLVFFSAGHLLRLGGFILLYFLPFFLCALSIGLIYVRNIGSIGRLYFSNLAGSGAGGFAALVLLKYLFPHHALTAAAFFPFAASILLIPEKGRRIYFTAHALFAALITLSIISPLPPSMSQYKPLARTKLIDDAEVTVKKSGHHSLVHIIESGRLRHAPGISLNYAGHIPARPAVFVNGNAAGSIPGYHGDSDPLFENSIFILPYLISDRHKVAVISSGTGTFVSHAINAGTSEIDAFEHNADLLVAMEKWHKSNYPSVYSHGSVSLYNIEARAFLRNTDKNYDLIYLPSAGSFGGSSGLDALKENFNTTKEALAIYWNSLNENGSLAVTVYTDFPPRATLKTVYMLSEMLRSSGISDPEQHMIGVRSWNAVNFVVSKRPVCRETIKNVIEFCRNNSFDPFILSGISHEEKVYFNYIPGTELFDLTEKILKGDTSEADDYLFYIRPATDNRPYFSRYLRISKFKDLMQKFPINEIPFLELGYLIVWLTLIFSIIFSAVLTILPVAIHKSGGKKIPVLLYFGSIGLGYMLIEIIFIQRFVLYLGKPLYAVTAVLGILLVSSGAGSYFSDRIAPGGKKHAYALAAISSVLIFYLFALTPVLNLTSGANIGVKSVITLFTVALPGFFMGMPFPLGLKAVGNSDEDSVPWAWGINGFFSVIAAPLALIVAVEAGSFAVFSAGAAAYLTALVSVRKIKIR